MATTTSTIARQPVDTEAMRQLIAKIKKAVNDEATARMVNDELLELEIQEASVQTDWEQSDTASLDYLKNKPIPITELDIDSLFT